MLKKHFSFLSIKSIPSSKKLLGLIAVSTLLMQGCAPLLIGAGVGALVSTDRRPAVLQTSDRALQFETSSLLKKEFPQSNIEVAVWNRRVLLLGTTYDPNVRQNIQARVASQPGVSQVFNELIVNNSPSILIAGNDALLTTRIKSALLAAQGVNSNSIKVVSHGSKVYLLGWVSAIERPLVLNSVRHTLGVIEVVDLMEEVR
jgi:osmotically-inducible protein OsmY